ncbi:MAG: cyclase family protein [Candidatus Binatia bacterium]
MQIHDITLALKPGIPSWPGEQNPLFKPIAEMAKGDVANVTLMSFASHTGTHVDAPSHFLSGGSTVDAMPLETLVGKALVVEIAQEDHISAATLEKAGISQGTERLLFKTRNSQLWHSPEFNRNFCAVTLDAANWLVDHYIKLVGIDYLSIEPFDTPPEHPTHIALLKAGVVIIEGLDLRAIPPGEYTVVCLPLKAFGLDGAPARVVLLEN